MRLKGLIPAQRRSSHQLHASTSMEARPNVSFRTAPHSQQLVNQLQRSIGNNAVSRLITGSMRSTAAASSSSSRIIQRTTDEEVRKTLNERSIPEKPYEDWLKSRTFGKGTALEKYLIKEMELEEVIGSVERFQKNRKGEEDYEEGADEVAIEALPKQLSESKILEEALKGYEIGKLKERVVVLGMDDFDRQHWLETVNKNPKLGEVDPVTALLLRVKKNAKIDRVSAFEADGKIYVRKGFLDTKTLVHEAVHSMGGNNFETSFGHHLMEGATEMIALTVCGELMIPAEGTYVTERKVLDKIMGHASLTFEDIATAYFSEDVSKVESALVTTAGVEACEALAKEKDIVKAYEAFANGLIAIRTKKKEEETSKNESKCVVQ